MKILHIIQRYPPSIGGSETWCQGISRYLAEQGHSVTVLTLKVYKEEEFWFDPPVDGCLLRFGRLEYDGKVKIIRCKRTRIHPLIFGFFKLLDRLFKIYLCGPHSIEMYLRMEKEVKETDIVHLHTIPYPHNLGGFFMAKLFRKKVVITPHFHIGHHQYERKIIFWLMKKCDAVFAVSIFEKEYLISKGLNKNKVFVAYNAINPEEYKPEDLGNFKRELFEKYEIKNDTKIIIFVGRKIEYKGIKTLIEAVGILRREMPIKLFLVGPNFSWFQEYYSTLSETEKKDIIDFGVVSHQEKVNLLHLSNLLVLPSKFEAFGIVFLEAWICGLPVIGSDMGVLPKIIDKGGLVFKYGDVEDLKEKIKILLSNQRLYKEMARYGREKVVNDYELNKVGKRILSRYFLVRRNKLKALVVSNLFPPYFLGGAELVAYEQARQIKALGHNVQIFCGKINNRIRQYRTTNERNIFKITRVNLHTSDLDIYNNNFHNILIERLFRERLMYFSPDIVHFHNLAGFPFGLIDECNKLKIKMVMTTHDYWPVCIKKTMLNDNGEVCANNDCLCPSCKSPFSLKERNAILKETLNRINHFICPSQYLANTLIKSGFSSDKISVIYNGIELSRFDNIRRRNSGDDILRLGYVGYLNRHKGIEYLLRAFSFLQNNSKIKLNLVVSGYEEEYISFVRTICKDLKIEKKVNFIYRIPNRKINKIYKMLDMLILASVWPENYPVSIAEAMASGIPVVASDIGGIRELVEHGRTGLLSPPKDIGKLAENIEYLTSSPQEIKRMGENGLNKIKNFDLTNQTKLIIEKYNELINLTNENNPSS